LTTTTGSTLSLRYTSVAVSGTVFSTTITIADGTGGKKPHLLWYWNTHSNNYKFKFNYQLSIINEIDVNSVRLF